MNKREMRANLRSLIDDMVEPYGWEDLTLDRYISEGMDKFCEDTGYFVDFKNFPIVTIVDEPDYDFTTDRIIEVLDLWNMDTGLKLTQFGEDNRPEYIPSLDVQQTVSYGWQTDQTTGMITLFPTPKIVSNLKARVWRYALVSFEDMTEDATPELPSRFHRAPIEYAAGMAYTHHDRERADLPKARDHFNMYAQYVVDGKKAFQRVRAAHPRLVPNQIYNFR